ncbi:uncharacterized protein JCM6883_005764 [Sporobolomyces salmoneus]|uniref:uncharacterized protein n=1 Tax=Sporobolomyces salmoneus TaxID=183962 RepID=UPI0031811140
MGKRARRSTADDEEEWDPTTLTRPRGTKKQSRPSVKDLSDSDASSQATTKSSSTPAPRKGGRTRVACDQCSKRRSRCSLKGPACDGCMERGDPESCSYQSLIWIDDIDDLPSRQLRRKLDALEAFLKARPVPTALPASPPKQSPVQLPIQLPSEFAINSVSSSLASCRNALARSLFTNGNLKDANLPGGLNMAELEFQLRQIDSNFLLKTARIPPTTPTSLPSPPQAHLAICFYSSTINPTFRLIFEPIFFRQCQEFWSSGIVPSSTWLALYLAVCTSGFRVILSDKEAMRQSGLLEDEVAQLADKCWTEARDIIEGEGFPLAANLESIQVSIILALSSLYGDSSHISRASSLISVAARCGLDYSLNIDPREGPANLTPLEIEMHRRTFWALYTCEAMFGLIVGSDISNLSSTNPSVRRPLFLSNDCYLASGNLSPIGVDATTRPLAVSPTSSLFTVASISVKALSIVNAGGAGILRLIEEIESFDGAFHSSEVADAMFCATFVFLHQASKEVNLAFTREQEVRSAKHFDSLLRAAASMGPSIPPDLLFFSTTLSLSVALRSCLVLFDGQIAFEQTRADLRNFGLSLNSSFRPSFLRRPASRCALLLSHILDRSPQSTSQSTPSLIDSSLTTPCSENALPSPAFGGSEPSFQYYLPDPSFENALGSTKPPVPLFHDSNVPHHQTDYNIHVSQSAHQPPLTRPFTAPPPARPLLTLRTTSAAPAEPKPATPVLSPWQDSSQTPSRYVGYAWNQSDLL